MLKTLARVALCGAVGGVPAGAVGFVVAANLAPPPVPVGDGGAVCATGSAIFMFVGMGLGGGLGFLATLLIAMATRKL